MNFESLKKINSIIDLPEDEQINIIGNLFDLSFDNKSLEGVEHAFKLSEMISHENLKIENLTLLYYYLANGWGYYRKIKYNRHNDNWDFQMEELTNEIYFLRKAIISPGFKIIIDERKCQIFTNLGNLFSLIGRFVEAQDYWNKALNIIPEFAMAIGNKGGGLYRYGFQLFDFNHKEIFMVFAYFNLCSALDLKHYLDIGAEKGIQELFNVLGSKLTKKGKAKLPDLNGFNLGNNIELVKYRKWCLESKLYINPLNDLGNFNIACSDSLNLPTITINSNRPPVFLNLYNQIKQEFGTARYSYYESIQKKQPQFSDFDVILVDTMESVQYSYYLEHLKSSYRLSYSILDKIAYLLNDYLKLGINSRNVSFKTLWYSDLKKSKLRDFFVKSENTALRGLFWLSKDLYEKDEEFSSVLEPEAKEIETIRNFIEHKGFKIISDFKLGPIFYDKNDDISYTISRSDFEMKVLNLLKLTRAAIMYLSLSISHEEKNKDYTGKIFPIKTHVIPNFMKI